MTLKRAAGSAMRGKGPCVDLGRKVMSYWSFFIFEVIVMLGEYIVFNSEVLA